MKRPKPETGEAAMPARVRPSVQAAAERLAQEDGRSLANWLEHLIEAEAAARRQKVKGRGGGSVR
jgi:predicted HicB family RNase H-like nuclease